MTSPDTPPVRDTLTAWVRTVVPALWSAGIAYLAARYALPAVVVTYADGVGAQVIVPVVLAIVYAGIRWMESRPWVPAWVTVVLTGSPKVPTYTSKVTAP